jgi:hypothetical protein
MKKSDTIALVAIIVAAILLYLVEKL